MDKSGWEKVSSVMGHLLQMCRSSHAAYLFEKRLNKEIFEKRLSGC